MLTLNDRQSEYRRRFSVAGLCYEFTAVNGGPVSFRVIAGETNLKTYQGGTWEDWDEDFVQFCDGGYFRTAMPVLRLVEALTIEWVRKEKPFGFHFHATDVRKHWIFRRLVDRHARQWADGYTHYMDETEFWFVRKQPVRLALH